MGKEKTRNKDHFWLVGNGTSYSIEPEFVVQGHDLWTYPSSSRWGPSRCATHTREFSTKLRILHLKEECTMWLQHTQSTIMFLFCKKKRRCCLFVSILVGDLVLVCARLQCVCKSRFGSNGLLDRVQK